MPGQSLRAASFRTTALVTCCTLGLAACATHAPKAALTLPPPPSAAPKTSPAQIASEQLSAMSPIVVPAVRHPAQDLSGRSETGLASFYARRFAGHRTADGQRFNPRAEVAASKTLPIGTVARVVNLENGFDVTVTIDDYGPQVASRMLDLSPAAAAQLRMTRLGIARVLVEPISIPQPGGEVKLGAGAATASPETVRAAVDTSRRLARRMLAMGGS